MTPAIQIFVLHVFLLLSFQLQTMGNVTAAILLIVLTVRLQIFLNALLVNQVLHYHPMEYVLLLAFKPSVQVVLHSKLAPLVSQDTSFFKDFVFLALQVVHLVLKELIMPLPAILVHQDFSQVDLYVYLAHSSVRVVLELTAAVN